VATKNEGNELRGVLDEEIAGLAERYRQPVVLCYLQGKTIEQAASLLACPAGTVAGRLARAKEQLQRRLTRRGWTLSAAAQATVLTDKALAAQLPAGLVASTVASASGKSANTGALAAKVIALSDGVLRMMWLNKMKMAAGVVLAVVLAGTGVGLVVRETRAGGGEGQVGEPAARAQKPTPKPDAQEGTKAEIAELRKDMANLRDDLDSALKLIRKLTTPSDKNAEIKKLLKERHDELAKAVIELTAQFMAGVVAFDTLAEAQRDALRPSLDVYDDSKERIAALDKFLEGTTQMYDVAVNKAKAGLVPGVAVRQARAMVLEARIALLREESKALRRSPEIDTSHQN
jgi:hypothetical protein